ncbi:MAG: 5'/3'-nucleotidase SurE [Acidobacteria bacterium]|nr:5'/3'-nucleotidase SurE [Acidobacteriota bacterium]
MPKILVTNDDGIRSAGLEALAGALEAIGDVIAVAPLMEASAVGHALTLRHPLRLEQLAANRYSVDGTPTDCVNVAVSKVLRGRPDLVVSGINKGANLGDDVTYSGTVAGAMEGALLGVPSLAVSLERRSDEFDFTQAAAAAVELATALLTNPLPSRTFLNVNVPHGRVKGLRVTVQGRRKHVTSVAEARDPRGQPYFWIEEGQTRWEELARSDHHAVADGWVSVTPLSPDLTDHAALPLAEALSLGREAGVK